MKMGKSKRAKAVDIPQKVKKAVWKRDGRRCVLCGNPEAMPNAHVIPRSQGGLGIEENVVTLCMRCHDALDHTMARKILHARLVSYLRGIYPGWDGIEKVYRKWGNA